MITQKVQLASAEDRIRVLHNIKWIDPRGLYALDNEEARSLLKALKGNVEIGGEMGLVGDCEDYSSWYCNCDCDCND